MKILIPFISILLFNSFFLWGQENKLELNLAYGYYESFSIGAKYNYSPEIKFGLLLGSNFALLNQENYFSATFENNIAIFKNKKDINDQYKWFFTNKIIYWDLENEYYRFNVLSLEPAITRNLYINNKIYLSFDIGPIFAIVLESYRKTFREIGWPYKVMPNFKIQFAYKI